MSRGGHIHIEHLNKQFVVDGAPLPVLRDLSLDVGAGEFVTLVGASGCGKSTLLRLIAGLEREHGGTLLHDGQPIAGTSLARGLVFQEHRLFPWLNVEANVRSALLNSGVPKVGHAKRVQRHIDLVGLQGFEKAWPHQLSGGMAQRVAIARAGQPAAGAAARRTLRRARRDDARRLHHELQHIWRTEGITMILVTHDVDEALFLGDRVVVMEPRPGRIRRVLHIDLHHPRERTSPVFADLKREVLAELGELSPALAEVA